MKVFAPSENVEWCPESEDDEEVTAICPYCGVDAILAESSCFPLTEEFLSAIEKKWFE